MPVAVLLVAVLHLVPDADDPGGVLNALYARVAGGSSPAVSHARPPERQSPAGMRAAQDTYAASGHSLHPRTRAEIEALLSRWRVQLPGLVACPLRRPGPSTTPLDPAVTFPCYAGLARKPVPSGAGGARRRHGLPAGAPG